MKVFTLFYILINIQEVHSWNPRLYPYDPRIHVFGNDNSFLSIHSKIAPIFTKYTDTVIYGRNLRKEVTDEEGDNKTFLDVGCGTGFSTSSNKGSLGLDTSKEMITMANKIFPNKDFEQGHIEHWKPDKKYEIVTAMFLFHEVPQFARLNIIENLKDIAKEKIIVVDIAPNYEPSKMMASGEPYIMDYLQNIRDDLVDFSEVVLQKNHVHKWTYNMKITDRFKTLDDIYYIDDVDLDSLSEEEVEYLSTWMMDIIMLLARKYLM